MIIERGTRPDLNRLRSPQARPETRPVQTTSVRALAIVLAVVVVLVIAAVVFLTLRPGPDPLDPTTYIKRAAPPK